MAMIRCKECSNDVSDKAKNCPSCGAPIISAIQKGVGIGCLTIIAIVGVIIAISILSSKDSADTNKGKCKDDDLVCWGDAGLAYASVYCKPQIEKLAKNDVKWGDTTFDIIFSRYKWKDQSAKTITYIGDSALFQNGFGAYSPVTYECDILSDNKTITDVRVTEGRLP